MKRNLLVLLVIQHVYFGKYNKGEKKQFRTTFFAYYRLAFLPIYFTAYDTGRHQVI
jgi:hypothetical protein